MAIVKWLYIFVVYQMLQHFKIEYHYGDMEGLTRLVLVPDQPLRLKLIDL